MLSTEIYKRELKDKLNQVRRINRSIKTLREIIKECKLAEKEELK